VGESIRFPVRKAKCTHLHKYKPKLLTKPYCRSTFAHPCSHKFHCTAFFKLLYTITFTRPSIYIYIYIYIYILISYYLQFNGLFQHSFISMLISYYCETNFQRTLNVFHSACSQTWAESLNTNTANGVANAASNLANCKAACLAYTGCTGVDWNTINAVGNQCWLSGSWNTGRNNGTQLNVIHYDLAVSGICTGL